MEQKPNLESVVKLLEQNYKDIFDLSVSVAQRYESRKVFISRVNLLRSYNYELESKYERLYKELIDGKTL